MEVCYEKFKKRNVNVIILMRQNVMQNACHVVVSLLLVLNLKSGFYNAYILYTASGGLSKL